jgi:hypothetical protein
MVDMRATHYCFYRPGVCSNLYVNIDYRKGRLLRDIYALRQVCNSTSNFHKQYLYTDVMMMTQIHATSQTWTNSSITTCVVLLTKSPEFTIWIYRLVCVLMNHKCPTSLYYADHPALRIGGWMAGVRSVIQRMVRYYLFIIISKKSVTSTHSSMEQ